MEQKFCSKCGKTNWSRWFEVCNCKKPESTFNTYDEYLERQRRVSKMKDFRCKCGRLLAKIKPNVTVIPNDILDSIETVKGIDKDNCTLEIKCPKCGQMNNIDV